MSARWLGLALAVLAVPVASPPAIAQDSTQAYQVRPIAHTEIRTDTLLSPFVLYLSASHSRDTIAFLTGSRCDSATALAAVIPFRGDKVVQIERRVEGMVFEATPTSPSLRAELRKGRQVLAVAEGRRILLTGLLTGAPHLEPAAAAHPGGNPRR